MIRRRTVVALGLSQLISWGVTYYLIGGFGEKISSDLGWSRDIVYGGFTISLLVMGLASPQSAGVTGRVFSVRGGQIGVIDALQHGPGGARSAADDGASRRGALASSMPGRSAVVPRRCWPRSAAKTSTR